MGWLAGWVRRHRVLSLLALVAAATAAVARVRRRSVEALPPLPPPPPPPPPSTGPGPATTPVPSLEGAPTTLMPPPEAVDVVESGPYPGSALPRPDGSAPAPEYTVKANQNSMRCHSPDSPYFRRTKAGLWFRTEEDAVAAGFRPWSHR